MRPVHPGEILRDEIDELGMSAKAFAEALDVPANRISSILNGQRGITADTALRLSRYLGTSPQVWLNLQKAFELRVAELEILSISTVIAVTCVWSKIIGLKLRAMKSPFLPELKNPYWILKKLLH